MKPKLYLETTVPSYLTARLSRDLIVAGHQEITREWWDSRRNDFSIYVSQFVLDEAGEGDSEMASRRLDVISEFELLDINAEVTELAAAILDAEIIPREYATDAAHIAIAAAHGVEFLMTWNCSHLANAEIANAIESVCDAHGFDHPVICTPEELMGA